MAYISNNPNINGSITTYFGASDFTSKKMLRFEIQRFDTDEGLELKKVGLEVLNVFGKILVDFGLVKLAQELEEAKDATEWLTKNANPVLKFIGATKFGKGFANYAKLITNSISILDNTLAIVKGDLPNATRNSKIGSIAGSLEAMADATNKLMKDNSNDNLWFLSIVSAGISLTASLIAGMDGVNEKEQEKINRSYIIFMKTLGSDLLKKIFDDTVEKAFNEKVSVDLLADMFKKGTFFKEVAPVFLKTFKGIMTFGTGILNGYSKYNNNLEKYLEDGIPEDIAKHDAFIDALAKFTKETMSGIVFGVDDVIFSFAKWITSGFGIEYAEDANKDYIETLIYKTKIKTLNYTNTGLSTDDAILLVLENGVMLYGDSGNDSIQNFGFSNATIWGGHDNDTIHSYKMDSVTPQNNSIFGGPGEDQIYIRDKLSTVYGGNDNDSILVVGTNNQIFGDAGNDSIYISTDADKNTVSGGAGDDLIILLEDTKNALIKYAEGNGNDTIYGFDEDDSFKISGSYEVLTADSDIEISVGSGSMLLRGAAGKNIKINGKTIKSGGSDDDTLSTVTISPPNVPTMPSIVESPFVYGTDFNDQISNYKDRVLIFSGAGDDYIYNNSDSVTIEGGAGNDSIRNFGYRSVKIEGGAGNDEIDNYGSSVKIDAGDGNDSIWNDVFSSSVTIDAGDGNDYIYNRYGTGYSVKIDGGAGNDSIVNNGASVTIEGGAGDDSIYNDYGSSVTIEGGAGNDSIVNYGASVTIEGGKGDDYIVGLMSDYDNFLHNNLIKYTLGDGNDTIYGLDADDTLKITEVEYSILPIGSDLIINLGDDSILIKDGNISSFYINDILKPINKNIVGTDNTDFIHNYSSNATVDGGAGDDSIYNRGTSVTIAGGAGNDSIYNDYGSSVTIEGGAGNDSIYNEYGTSVTIDGGAGADLISLYSSPYYSRNNTIAGSKDNDTIFLNSETTIGNTYVYNFGDGNDTIYYATKYDTISIGGGTYSTQTIGSDLIIKVGSDAMTLVGAANTAVNIVGTLGTGNDEEPATVGATINNTVSGVTLNGTANKDFLTNSGDEVLITADADADTIFSYGDSVTIDAGAGDDIIDDAGINSVIDGGAGKDRISLAGGGLSGTLTVSGGLGDDTIYGDISAHIYRYASGDGNDTIFGFNSDDTLYISTGSISSASVSGEDVVLKIGSGSVNLKAAKAQPIRIKNASGAVVETIIGGDNEDTLPPDTDTLPAGISISGATLTASTAFAGNKINLADYATTVTKVNASALSRGISIVGTAAANSLKGGTGADTIFGGAGNDTVSLGGGADIYVYQRGNDMIQDYTAGADKISLASASITGASISGSNVVLKTSSGNLTVKNGKGKNITLIDAAGKETTQIYPSITPEPTLSSGLTYDAKKTAVTLASSFSGTLKAADYASTVKKIDATKVSKSINIIGNAQANTISGGAGNDKLYGEAGNDKLLGGAGADTLYGGAGADTLTGGDGKDVFVYANGDGADVITDFTAGQDSVKLTSGTIASASLKGSDMVFKIGSGSFTVKNGKGKEISVGSSIYFNNLAYDAKKTAVTLASSFSGTLKTAEYASTVKKIDATKVSRSINIVGNAQANTISGGAGNDKLYGENGNDKLLGGAGADTLYGGAGADTLTGGDGKDVFVYANGDGADVIADFTAGQDSIKLTSGTVASASLKGSDMVLKIGSSSLTVKNGKGKEISVGSAVYYNNLVYDAKKTAVALASSFSGTLKATDYVSTVKKIDATKVSKSINITGNAQANTIIGGGKAETIYGGKGNDSISGGAGNDKIFGEAGNDKLLGGAGADTLYGGAGDDTLTGGDGKDVFVYANGDGKDVITDYTAGQDKIKLASGTISSVSYSGNNVVFNVGSGSITVQNGKGKKITIVDAAGKTSTQTYSGAVSGRSAMWFMEGDDNFITNNTELSETFRESCSEFTIGDLSVSYDVVNLTAELATAVPIFRATEKN